MTDKEAIEWAIIKTVKDRYSDFPHGEITKSAHPDFLVGTPPQKITGIEVTEYHHGYGDQSGDQTKQADNSWEKVRTQARQALEKRLPNKSFHISVQRPSISRPLAKSAIPEMVKRLVQVVIDNYPQNPGDEVELSTSQPKDMGSRTN